MYKAVRVIDGERVSAVSEQLSIIRYSADTWSETPEFLKAQGRGPFVFETIKHALDFIYTMYYDVEVEIWECQARNLREPGIFFDIFELDFGRMIPTFSYFPEGTMECDSVRLIKCVHTIPVSR